MIHAITKRGKLVPIKEVRLHREPSLYGGEDRITLCFGRLHMTATPSQIRKVFKRILASPAMR